MFMTLVPHQLFVTPISLSLQSWALWGPLWDAGQVPRVWSFLAFVWAKLRFQNHNHTSLSKAPGRMTFREVSAVISLTLQVRKVIESGAGGLKSFPFTAILVFQEYLQASTMFTRASYVVGLWRFTWELG